MSPKPPTLVITNSLKVCGPARARDLLCFTPFQCAAKAAAGPQPWKNENFRKGARPTFVPAGPLQLRSGRLTAAKMADDGMDLGSLIQWLLPLKNYMFESQSRVSTLRSRWP